MADKGLFTGARVVVWRCAMDPHQAYVVLIDLLQQVVAARGGDASGVAAQYPWPNSAAVDTAAPPAAVSLAPLLTGGTGGEHPGGGLLPAIPGTAARGGPGGGF
jgi:hypothetical protein